MDKSTLAEMMDGPNGFNTIRLLAAVVVIFSHAFPIMGLEEPLLAFTGQTTVGFLAVGTFFVISGLLISISFDRGSLARYTLRRTQRIMPCLIVAVLICALLLGPLVTTLAPSRYFVTASTWTFLGHGIFLPANQGLPGVFHGNPMDAVNGSLWTLKFEVTCYAIVAVALSMRELRRPVVIVGWVASFVIARAIPAGSGGALYYLDMIAELFRFFGTGMLFYLYRDRVPVRAEWGWIAFAILLASAFTPFFNEIAATFGAYALVTFAHLCSERFRQFTARGDISYGVYVYAFPIQQLLAPICLGLPLAWLVNAMATLPLVAIAGTISWVVIEKPALKFQRSRPLPATVRA